MATLGLLAGAAPAFAHAIVVSSQPQPRETVQGPDIEVEIRFNSRVDCARSRLMLKSGGGPSVILTLEETGGESLRAKASGLASGPYEILWQTLSVDGHITHGVIPFEVGR